MNYCNYVNSYWLSRRIYYEVTNEREHQEEDSWKCQNSKMKISQNECERMKFFYGVSLFSYAAIPGQIVLRKFNSERISYIWLLLSLIRRVLRKLLQKDAYRTQRKFTWRLYISLEIGQSWTVQVTGYKTATPGIELTRWKTREMEIEDARKRPWTTSFR